MKLYKCPGCGANIYNDKNKDINRCEYCNTPFATDEPEAKAKTSSVAQNIVKTSVYVEKPPRPRLNIFLTIFLFWFYFFPGLIYVASVKSKQKAWDEKYS